MKEIIKNLIKVANSLDEKGFSEEASKLDSCVHDIVGDENPDSSYMSVSNMDRILYQSEKICDVFKENPDIKLESWIEDKISTSADDIEEVYHYIINHKDKITKV